MATLNLSLNTETQEIAVTVDGNSLEPLTVSGVEIWRYVDHRDHPEFHFTVRTNDQAGDVSLMTITSASKAEAAPATAKASMTRWGLERRGKS